MKRPARLDLSGRRHDFDSLRAISAVLVVVAHTASTFSPWTAASSNYDPIFNRIETSKLFSEFLWILNLWLMPLFMLLAGASAWYGLRRRTKRQYLRERLVHLGLPFVVLFFGVAIPLTYFAQAFTGGFSGSFPEYVLSYFDGIYPNGHFHLFHLWFLLYLLTFVVITLSRCIDHRRKSGSCFIARIAAARAALGPFVLRPDSARAAAPDLGIRFLCLMHDKGPGRIPFPGQILTRKVLTPRPVRVYTK